MIINEENQITKHKQQLFSQEGKLFLQTTQPNRIFPKIRLENDAFFESCCVQGDFLNDLKLFLDPLRLAVVLT